MDIVIRTEGEPSALASVVRDAVHSIDEDLPVHALLPMTDYVSQAMAERRFTLILGSIFGVVALLLASIALYGLISYTVSQRARELGIRMALGAPAAEIFGLVISQGLRLILVGIVIGVPSALFATEVLSTLLFGVSATDPVTFVGMPLLLAAVAIVACYVPARRATRMDPSPCCVATEALPFHKGRARPKWPAQQQGGKKVAFRYGRPDGYSCRSATDGWILPACRAGK